MDWKPPLINVPIIGVVLYLFSMNWILSPIKVIHDFKKGARGWKGCLRLIINCFILPYGVMAVLGVWSLVPAATIAVLAEMAGLDHDASLVLLGILSVIGAVIAARVVVNYCRLLSKQPEQPISASPMDGQDIQTLTPEFSWSAYPEAIDYSLQVATDAKFRTLLIDEKRIVDNHYHVPAKILRSNAEYFWRVDARTNKTTIRLFSWMFLTLLHD